MTNKSNFYNHVQAVLTNDQGFQMGRNLDAFNDVLWGGFGDFDYGEPITIIWESFRSSEKSLNPKFLKAVLEILDENENVELVLK